MERRHVMLAGSLLLSVIGQVWCQLCGGHCKICPWPTPRCPPGVPLVLDGCHCCQMCARQEGEGCTEMLVCDSHQGLQCDYSASFPGGPGECVSQNSLGCELNGMQLQEGQTFQPSCAQLCHCLGGGITCVPLCHDDLQAPDPANCANAQLVRLPGRCCREWVCDGLDNNIYPDAMTAAEKPPVRGAVHHDSSGGVLVFSKSRGLSSNCMEQTSDWSPCSRSCGPGVSTRSSNKNWACLPQTQTRLCQVRPCQASARLHNTLQWGTGACESSYKSAVLVRLEHQNCLSLRLYRPQFCGLKCLDGRCCSPSHTRTIHLAFRCQQGRIILQQVMMIESCSCQHNYCAQYPFTAYRTVSG